MTGSEFMGYWWLGLAIGGAVVLVVAALLLVLIATARGIRRNAERALQVADEIVATTRPVWELETTLRVTLQLRETARAIEDHAGRLVEPEEGARDLAGSHG